MHISVEPSFIVEGYRWEAVLTSICFWKSCSNNDSYISSFTSTLANADSPSTREPAWVYISASFEKSKRLLVSQQRTWFLKTLAISFLEKKALVPSSTSVTGNPNLWCSLESQSILLVYFSLDFRASSSWRELLRFFSKTFHSNNQNGQGSPCIFRASEASIGLGIYWRTQTEHFGELFWYQASADLPLLHGRSW